MPERMIKAFREPDDLTHCIQKLEYALSHKRFLSKAKRKYYEGVLGYLKVLEEYENAPALKAIEDNDFLLAQYDIIRIVGYDKSVTVYNTEYGKRSNFIYTLEDCLNAAFKMMLPQIVEAEDLHFIVIASNPLKGIVLEYGNHGPKFEQIGVTCGYA